MTANKVEDRRRRAGRLPPATDSRPEEPDPTYSHRGNARTTTRRIARAGRTESEPGAVQPRSRDVVDLRMSRIGYQSILTWCPIRP